jgi:hypothetical protein
MPESSVISFAWRFIFSKACRFICDFICEYFLKTGVALPEELSNPLVGNTARTESSCIG